jgi:hypothetical protein
MLLIISIGAAITKMPDAKAQASNNIQTFAYINVAPDPCGVGQSVTVDFWLAVPLADSELAVNMTVLVTAPDGTKTTLGPFISDITGGTTTHYTPEATGNYTFQFIYGGQTLAGAFSLFGGPTFAGYYEEPSQSAPVTLTVQSTPASGIPYTPLPTQYWETPVNAENVQNWYALTGSWMGYSANTFATTGGYNMTGSYNPYTTAPTTAHILWTKPWALGGVAGGELGNSEQNSDFWTTSQYDPKYAPIIMDGIEYSTWYTTNTGGQQGILAMNLYNGQTMWVINTTNPLRCGMIVNFENINQYGDVGPYIWTQSGGGIFGAGANNWYMYDGMTGQYEAEITNAASPSWLGQDPNGNIIGYLVNDTTGTMVVNGVPVTTDSGSIFSFVTFTSVSDGHPIQNSFELWNMTQCLAQTGLNWAITPGTVYQWKAGIQWDVLIPTTVNGLSTGSLVGGGFGFSSWSGNTIVMSSGAISVAESLGWQLEAGFNTQTGALMWIDNRTGGIFVPYTRISNTPSGAAGVYVEINQATYEMAAYSLTTGDLVWTNSLDVKMADGNMPNTYDEYDFETVPDTTTGVLYVWALGGDVWAVNMANGNILWSWSTLQANGPTGIETPYGVYPIWVFQDEALAGTGSGTILYLSEGHEYSPPLFHGALELALNATSGQLVWDNLGYDVTGTAVADGIMTTYNAYDAQIYAYGQGPSKTTVTAPNVGVTTATPVVISGTVTDVSAGASQEAVAANFPNGLPCVSDASMTQFMEYVYEQQVHPSNTVGVPVTLTAKDPNGNQVTLGTVTSDQSGYYSLTWTPPLAGNYTISATFQGTGSYYGSYAETSIFAGNPAPTQAPAATPAVSGLATMSGLTIGIAVAIIAIIIAIAIVGLLLLRRKV